MSTEKAALIPIPLSVMIVIGIIARQISGKNSHG